MRIKLLTFLMSIIFLSGCVQKMNNAELLGAAAGGAMGGYAGSALGQGLARIAYVTSGILIGSSAGTLSARVLEKSDLLLYEKTAEYGLSTTPNGTLSNWKNDETGSSGAFRPMTTYSLANGKICRAFRTTIAFPDAIESGTGIACRQKSGEWKVVSDKFG